MKSLVYQFYFFDEKGWPLSQEKRGAWDQTLSVL
jgi:hypothetical protein